MIILLDIGNTYTHIGLASEEEIVHRRDFKTESWFSNELTELVELLKIQRRYGGAAICSVVPEATKRAIEFFTAKYGITPFLLTYLNAPLKGFKYPKPETLGADRIANCIAAYYSYGVPSIVIDFGTAVTLDVLDSDGYFIGGVIAPGVEMFSLYLSGRTALLPMVNLREYDGFIGKSTEEAILISMNSGFAGMIKTLIDGIIRSLNCNQINLIATGGYADFVVKKIGLHIHLSQDITLHGLRIAYFKNR